ncbi:hypothetical protein CONPUDRAFT_168749 [Coniophora puteana RWD-64-598 SS2]|uniref:Cyclin N-terminal domain-containing protein n=1 Tax=Coniophora puteana (strain RWD-64-598) TaxID=741705 RepID=A0A5M3MA51_CONPW|nr:uncharacterized protein CONPUDRAFT_168749 [Coniophora puteana RWD-64-598 SS2]EIW76162.1 hypothetical protein CONPUDRAFT_168749 [Coniophora puteana RWD-64-598 SS2]
MPVPVPTHNNAPAHPVIKSHKHGELANYQSVDLRHLKHTHSIASSRPLSFDSREGWTGPSPPWNRFNAPKVWEKDTFLLGNYSFTNGLAFADNVDAIKGERADACIPPSKVSRPMFGAHPPCSCGGCRREDEKWCYGFGGGLIKVTDSYLEGDMDEDEELPAYTSFQDVSPGFVQDCDMPSSSPGPLTPFGDFIDRAATTQPPTSAGWFAPQMTNVDTHGSVHHQSAGYREPPCDAHDLANAVTDAFSLASTENLSSNVTCKKLAGPFAEWLVGYVWRVCTNSIHLPASVAKYPPPAAAQCHDQYPSWLAGTVHSVLLSTLLQPSAVLLSLWYIARLPVFLGVGGFGPEHVKELRFRSELFGNPGMSKDSPTASPIFRLIILGFMFANKWLDDHTFSNKTWHSITGIPVQSINKLELLALGILNHDLSVPRDEWKQWLQHLLVYHHGLSTSSFPQPISRPSSSPQSILRKAMEEISAVSSSADVVLPAFIGLEHRRAEKNTDVTTTSVEGYEIDLDEDGPLRAEYLPKRRSIRPGMEADHALDMAVKHEPMPLLPPPARWSPAGDEPLQQRNRISGQYAAVQPSIHLVPAAAAFPVWSSAMVYMPAQPPVNFGYDPTYMQAPLQHQFSCDGAPRLAHQPLFSNASNVPPYSHARTMSQPPYEYPRNMTLEGSQQGFQPYQQESMWPRPESFGFAPPYRPFPAHPNTTAQSTWSRA